MATAAKSTKGVLLKRGDSGSPEVFTKVAEVKDISGPDESAEQIECTSLESTSKEYIAGLRDGGEVQCDANSINTDAQQQALYADFQAGTKRNYQIVCPDGEIHAFSAIITKHSRKFSPNAPRGCSFSLKISGDVTPTWPVA